MSNYELCLVVNAKVEDDVRNASLEDAKKRITRFGGEIKNIDEWGKRRLAYEIDKLTEGIYAVIEFKSEPDQLKELSRVLGLRPFVVRQLTIAVGE